MDNETVTIASPPFPPNASGQPSLFTGMGLCGSTDCQRARQYDCGSGGGVVGKNGVVWPIQRVEMEGKSGVGGEEYSRLSYRQM